MTQPANLTQLYALVNFELNVLSFIFWSCLAWDINLRFNMSPRWESGSYPDHVGEFIAKALSLFGLPENQDLAVKLTLMVCLAQSERISVKAFFTWHKWVQSAQFNLLLLSSVVMLNHKQAERSLANSQRRIRSKNSDLNSRRILFLGVLAETFGASWPEIEMLWSESLGKSTSNCSQKPLAGEAEKRWVRHQQGAGRDAAMRWLTLAVQGF